MKKKPEFSKNSTKIKIDTHEKTILEIYHLIEEKITHIQTIIRNTIISINNYKKYDIFSNSDVIICISSLVELYEKSNAILSQINRIIMTDNIRLSSSPANGEGMSQNIAMKVDSNVSTKNTLGEINDIIDTLQTIIDKISIIISGFGTKYMQDLFFISFGSEFNDKTIANPVLSDKYQLLLQYVRPIGCKTVHWKQNKSKPKENGMICSNKIVDDNIQIELSNNYECFDVDNSIKSIYVKIYGIRIVIHNEKAQKTLIVHGIVEDIVTDCLSNLYIHQRKQDILSGIDETGPLDPYIVRRMVDTMTLKDMFIWGKEDMYKKYAHIMMEVNGVKQNKLNITISKFIELDICDQRQTLIHLLIYDKEDEIQYITYLLYDLITANSSGTSTDSLEQLIIYESFPWKIKLFFKETMKNTIKYTKDMMQKYDVNRITLEQQIYVMKAPENIKEKAMLKLKEIKGKPDDSGTKAKQYLEGLLRIPFGVFREEPILKKMKLLNTQFGQSLNKMSLVSLEVPIAKKEKYTTAEMIRYITQFETALKTNLSPTILSHISSLTAKQIINVISFINAIYRIQNHRYIVAKTKEERVEAIATFVEDCMRMCQSPTSTSAEIAKYRDYLVQLYDFISIQQPETNTSLLRTANDFEKTKTSIIEIKTELDSITQILDDSIYGHSHAKSQILKIIGQWMNGEQSGYCFGFEGSPGIGKTSLAKKGLSRCLVSPNGESRPFAFIALGGSCNGSTLEGHSYTYVNSTWGRIVDILMDTKCMNPIIYIDELDKVSKTEHGKEIIGILTHLIDTTQNDVFQDKYFSGIDLDLSKALFIFSYNDPQQIDRILLDRIHRIKFDNLSLDEKIVIVKRYVLPEINRKMGFADSVILTDEIIEYIIETYTMEPGIRKLKEVIFDLYGDINMEILKCGNNNDIEMPMVITVSDLTDKYLSKYDKVTDKHIHTTNEIGVINGLWASAYGRGGIIPIQTMFFPTSSFLELRLTGLQGDVMKESMNVAKSLAWNLVDLETKKQWAKHFDETKCQGLHIHCPEGAVSKDGPSAGAAITLAIYSLLTKRPIIHTVAITGEINLQGFITEIGGLDCKIAGGIKAGITTFLFPEKNRDDYDKYIKKNGSKKGMDQITFIPVSHITDTFPHVFGESIDAQPA
jgi:ATP-dependent Lon protease